MTGWLTPISVLVSLTGVVWLLRTNDKRRRSHGVPAYPGRRYTSLAWWLVVQPGVLLLAAGEGAAFLIWMGAVPVIGWLLALRRPAPLWRSKG